MKSTRQGNNDGGLLYPNHIGCKARRQRVQLDGDATDSAIAPMHPSGYVLGYRIASGLRYYCHLGRRISIACALRYSITTGARCWCHLGRRRSVARAMRYSITSGARCRCHLGRKRSVARALRYSITSGARCWCHLGRKRSVAWALRYNITWRLSTYIGCQTKPQGGAMGPAEGAIAPIAPAWLKAW